VYTLQGWIKGVNGHEFSYALGYYEGDYQSIGTSSNLATPVAGNLYNGNIATMATHTPALGTKNPAQAWQTQQFVYDQLNRIKESRTTGGHENAYRTGYSYDANGNIVSLSRFDGSGTKQFDQLAYRYENKQSGYGRNTNKLRWVDDGTSVTEDFEDIRDQDIDNYEYDAIGNLVRDEQEEIDRIEWTVYGKVKAVHRKAGSEKPYLEFGYDAGGNRISKLSRDKDGHEKVTLYVRDASGNVMAIYEKTPERALAVTEHHVYGSSRLGIARTTHPTDLAMLHSGRVLGLKDFELSDHLGNVRVVLKDVRNSVGLTEVSAAYDYYAFGMIMPGRKVDNGTRYLYNGMEFDHETGLYITEFRQYDPRSGKWLSLDPLMAKYPHQSGYSAFNNNPIFYRDPTGLEGEEPEKTHKVEKGNTLTSIAEKYNTTIDAIKKANEHIDWTSRGDNQDIIYAGEQLKLYPKESTVETVAKGVDLVNFILGTGDLLLTLSPLEKYSQLAKNAGKGALLVEGTGVIEGASTVEDIYNAASKQPGMKVTRLDKYITLNKVRVAGQGLAITGMVLDGIVTGTKMFDMYDKADYEGVAKSGGWLVVRTAANVIALYNPYVAGGMLIYYVVEETVGWDKVGQATLEAFKLQGKMLEEHRRITGESFFKGPKW